MKVCKRCGVEKPTAKFPTGKRECIACKGARKRARLTPEQQARLVAQRRDWAAANRDVLAEAARRAYHADRERHLERNRRWRESHPGERAEARRRRRGREGAQDAQGFDSIVALDVCAYCGGLGGEVDHIDALAGDGQHEWENLTGACGTCNRSKFIERLLPFLLRRIA